MLTIQIAAQECFDELTGQFITTEAYTLTLEHSLVSISKWEAKWEKSFLSRKDKTTEEIIDYIKCMTINKNVPDEVYNSLTSKNIQEIMDYINRPMTATTFPEDNKKPNREIITSELIYYWMISYQIPVQFEKWHINRLLTLIKVCSVKNGDPKKMSKSQIAKQNSSLNAARRKAAHSKG